MVDDWIPHRRSDGEVVGYARLVDEAFQPLDLLGRPLGAATDWMTTEALLEAQTLSWLAEPWLLRLDDGSVRRTRIAEVSPTHATFVDDRLGSIDGDAPPRHVVALPIAPDRLAAAPPLDEFTV